MKKYIGTKIVEAEACTRQEFWDSVDYPVEARKENGEESGYIVVYPDGYVSWSPKATFEETYNEIN